MAEQELVQQPHVAYRLHDCLVLIELHSALAVVSDFQGLSALNHSAQRAVPGNVPGQQIQEGGFSCPVLPDNAHTLEALEIVGEVVQVHVRPIAEADIFAVDYLAAQSGTVSHRLQAHLSACIDLLGPVLEVVERIDTVSCLSCPRAWGTPYPLQLAAQDIVHFGSLCIVIVDALLPFFQIVLVISPVGIDCPVVEFHHSIAHIVQEIPVVRHHQQGAARMPEIILKELDGVDVQMVGRLVHYEEVRL